MLGAKIAVARAAGGISRVVLRGGGTTLPGAVLLRLAPDAIERLGARLRSGSIVVSATNGKTTTATMIAAILDRAGERVVHNHAGANMASGVATALAGAARAPSGISGERGLFEVDEFWLPQVAAQLRPRALLLSNLFRDQLDRYGELEAIAERWSAVAAARAPGSALVLNADDPIIADLGRDGEARTAGVVYFGVEDDRLALPELQHASDAKHCRRCGAAYSYEAAYVGHLGHYHCDHCGQTRPTPDVVARDVTLDGVRAASFRLDTPQGSARVALPLAGLYNVYNAVAAAAVCLTLGVTLETVVEGLRSVGAAFGRGETIQIGERSLVILLVKNPAGANEVMRTLALEDGDADVLAVLNDKTADGRDVSWVWDADFELLAGRVRAVWCSGTRAGELALRLKYAGVGPDRITVDHDLAVALDAALAGGRGTLFVLPTYTALLSLRRLLSERGLAAHYWE